jgi:antitoxin CptB
MLKEEALKRLRWQCRRGLLELDLLLGNFLEKGYAALDMEKKAQFSTLLSCSDQELLYWFTDQAVPPEALKDLVATIKKHAE